MKLFDVSAPFGMPVSTLFENMRIQHVDTVEDADLVAFGGGADLGTKMYGHNPVFPGQCASLSIRDAEEKEIFEKAIHYGKPMLGICRGAQLLCALSGGALIQHANGHTMSHFVFNMDGDEYEVSSTHHQMMLLPPDKFELIEYSMPLSREYIYDKKAWKHKLPEFDPETVYFPYTRALAIQHHPEYNPRSHASVEAREYIHMYLGV